MKAARLIAYGALGVITGLLVENKALKMRRLLEMKADELKRKARKKCEKTRQAES